VLSNTLGVRVIDSETAMDQHVRAPAKDRLFGILAYLAILFTCIAGMLHTPWWAACAGASLLALLSIADPRGSHAYYARLGVPIPSAALFASTALNAGAAASTAYLLGRAIAWIWGL
jgi:hypothetical protein